MQGYLKDQCPPPSLKKYIMLKLQINEINDNKFCHWCEPNFTELKSYKVLLLQAVVKHFFRIKMFYLKIVKQKYYFY